MDIKQELKKRAKEAEETIYDFLPAEDGEDAELKKAMNYSVKAGGKRIRPVLMSSFHMMLGGCSETLPYFMAAIEMIHTYSLIHDDLPAMDNDMLRRGKPTTHAAFGEAMAILAGDGLLNLAFETAADSFPTAREEGDKQLLSACSALYCLAKKAGTSGMVSGQSVDVESEKKGIEITRERLDFIYENKTAALLEASMMIGAILAGADPDTVEAAEKIGHNIGLAFQIRDDILDVTGDEKILGKDVGSDEKNGKNTYVTFEGLEASENDVKRLTDEAIAELTALKEKNSNLRVLSEYEFLTELFKYLTEREV